MKMFIFLDLDLDLGLNIFRWNHKFWNQHSSSVDKFFGPSIKETYVYVHTKLQSITNRTLSNCYMTNLRSGRQAE